MRSVIHKSLPRTIFLLNRMESWFNDPDPKWSEIGAAKLKGYTTQTHPMLLVKVAQSILAGHTIPWMDVADEWRKVKVTNPKREALIAEKRARHPSRCV